MCCMCAHLWEWRKIYIHMPLCMHVEVRGPLEGAGSLLPLRYQALFLLSCPTDHAHTDDLWPFLNLSWPFLIGFAAVPLFFFFTCFGIRFHYAVRSGLTLAIVHESGFKILILHPSPKCWHSLQVCASHWDSHYFCRLLRSYFSLPMCYFGEERLAL